MIVMLPKCTIVRIYLFTLDLNNIVIFRELYISHEYLGPGNSKIDCSRQRDFLEMRVIQPAKSILGLVCRFDYFVENL